MKKFTSGFLFAAREAVGVGVVIAALAAPACTGGIGGSTAKNDSSFDDDDTGDDGSGGSAGGSFGMAPGPAFACNEEALPPVDTLKKLTESQLRNTLADLMAFALGDEDAAKDAIKDVRALNNVPKDTRAAVPEDLHGSYRRLDQTLNQSYVDALYDVEAQVAGALTTSSRLGKVVGVCATDGDTANDSACVTNFIKRFGERALRRPLGDDEVDFYREVYASTGIEAAGFSDVIAALLGAPQFVYHLETGDTPVEGKSGLYNLSPYEVAARLSYQFWDTMPDDELWEAAQSGELVEDETYRAQVERLIASPRARETLERFYVDWLKLQDVKPMNTLNEDKRFKAFAAADLPTESFHEAAIEDVAEMFKHYTWGTSPGSLRDVLTSDLSFARSEELAKIYDVPVWDGQSEPPTLDGNRTGLLTRAAFLTSPSGNTRPIMKGVFIRNGILCDAIPPPPKDAAAVPITLSTELTTREVVEGITEVPGTSCAHCHTKLINPLGFITEGFDALGRARTMQPLFDDGGAMKRELPVDTRTMPQVVLDDETEAEGPADLARLIVESGKADACLARQYFRFSYARWEDEAVDGCTLERLRNASGADRGSLAMLLREIAFAPSFRQRRFE